MKLQSILSLVVLILLATGCRKDISETSTSNPIVPNPEYTFESSISGIVVDNNAEAIANAMVTMGDDELQRMKMVFSNLEMYSLIKQDHT